MSLSLPTTTPGVVGKQELADGIDGMFGIDDTVQLLEQLTMGITPERDTLTVDMPSREFKSGVPHAPLVLLAKLFI